MTECSPPTMCLMTHVRCQVSGITCREASLPPTCHLSRPWFLKFQNSQDYLCNEYLNPESAIRVLSTFFLNYFVQTFIMGDQNITRVRRPKFPSPINLCYYGTYIGNVQSIQTRCIGALDPNSPKIHRLTS